VMRTASATQSQYSNQ